MDFVWLGFLWWCFLKPTKESSVEVHLQFSFFDGVWQACNSCDWWKFPLEPDPKSVGALSSWGKVFADAGRCLNASIFYSNSFSNNTSISPYVYGGGFESVTAISNTHVHCFFSLSLYSESIMCTDQPLALTPQRLHTTLSWLPPSRNSVKICPIKLGNREQQALLVIVTITDVHYDARPIQA